MTRADLLKRLITDPSFEAAVRTAPDEILKQYEISDSTVEALKSGDEEAIRAKLNISQGSGIPNR